MQGSYVVGTIVSKFKSDKGRVPMARVTLKYRRPTGVDEEGKLRYEERYANVLVFRQQADALYEVPEGTTIWAEGEGQAGKPYQDKRTEEWRSSFEIAARNWAVVSPGATVSAPSNGGSEEEEAPPPRTTAASRPATPKPAPKPASPPVEDFDDPFNAD